MRHSLHRPSTIAHDATRKFSRVGVTSRWPDSGRATGVCQLVDLRLRLRDLRHFRRRREAFQSRPEDRLSVNWAPGRLIELGQRQRGAQFKAARALCARDGDCGPEGLFRRLETVCVAAKQQFAARAMQFGLERAKAQTLNGRLRFSTG